MSAFRSTLGAMAASLLSQCALLDLEAEILEHRPVGLGCLSPRRQVVADEDRVGGLERERLQRAQLLLAASGDADLLSGAHETKEREDLEAAARVELVPTLERRARDRVQEIDRDGVDVEVAEGVGDVDDLLVRLAHAGDETRTGGDARRSDGLERRQAIVVGVGRRDPRVVARGGVEVVVVPLDPGLEEIARLCGGEKPEARADLHRQLLLDPAYGSRHLPELPRARPAATRDDAVRPGLP